MEMVEKRGRVADGWFGMHKFVKRQVVKKVELYTPGALPGTTPFNTAFYDVL